MVIMWSSSYLRDLSDPRDIIYGPEIQFRWTGFWCGLVTTAVHISTLFLVFVSLTFFIPNHPTGAAPGQSTAARGLHSSPESPAAGIGWSSRLPEAPLHLNALISEVEDAQGSLWESLTSDDVRRLEAAVRRGAVVERRNGEQMTPLAQDGPVGAVWALLRFGAAVDSTARAVDWTPLLCARA